jgi:cold-inducible RNA-binding protein
MQKTNKLFVAGIAYYDMDGKSLTGEYGNGKLAELFSQAGEVVKAEIVTEKDMNTGLPTRRSKGFGFVTMKTVEEAEKAIEMLNNTHFESDKFTLAVRFSEERKRDDNRTGGGADRGGSDRRSGGFQRRPQF